MRRFFALSILFLFSLLSLAQERRLVIRHFGPGDIGDMRARTAPVYDNNNRLAALIEISFSEDDEVLFDGIVGAPIHHTGEWLVRVPEGLRRLKVTVPGCKPIEYAFPEALLPESGRVYKMDLGIETTVKLRTLILPSFSWNKSQNSYGVMLGFCKKNGAYLRAKTDFTFGLNPVLACDADGHVNGIKGWFSGEAQSSRFALTAGYLRRLFDISRFSSMYGYIGGGYGSRILAWQMYGSDGDYELVRVTPNSFTGYEVETGILLRLGGFALSAGVQTNQFKYVEANVGIGIMF